MAYPVAQIANQLLLYSADKGGELMTNMKLQKMLYYQQGFHLAYFGTPLFEEDIEAWMYGPVVPAVYDEYSAYGSSALPEVKEPVSLSEDEEELFNEVYDAYREFSAIGLMNRTHSERPWLDAVPHDRGTVITQESMMAHFKTQIQ